MSHIGLPPEGVRVLTRLAQQLAATLEAQILDGRWRVGERLPPERDLARQHEVSRSTMREALDELERAGLILRHQGRGTFVAPRRLEQSLLGHFSIVESLRASGRAVSTRVLAERVGPPSRSIAAELGCGADDAVLQIERLRFADRVPFMLERTWLPLAHAPGLDTVDLSDRSLYEVLRTEYGIVLERAVESFEPVLLRPEEAKALDCPAGAPALLLLRTTYDSRGVAIECARALLRADLVRPLVERKVHEPVRY
jgi:GntR family transcriptional regulator